MSAVVAVTSRPRRPVPAPARLFWLELRHNAMAWAVPLALALFWLTTFRKVLALPPLWNVRAAATQSGVALDFIVPVTGVAAWTGSRETRRRTADMLATVPAPRAARWLVTWAAMACWALVGWLVCIGGTYAVTAAGASFGGPLWWPAAVSAACMPAFTALGLAAGTLLPSRFTAPAVAVVAFFAFALSTELITGSRSAWQVSPLTSGPWDTGSDAGVATFYPYLPDLALAQLMFLAGLTVAILAAATVLLSRGRGMPARVTAAGIAAAGLAGLVTAVGLTGTGSLGPTGMLVIPALHDAARDRLLPVSLVCGRAAIPVCLNPAYATYLPGASAALAPLLREISDLPGAPAKLVQAPAEYHQLTGNGVDIRLAGPQSGTRRPVFRFLLPDQLGGPAESSSAVAAQLWAMAGPALAARITGAGPGARPAQNAVATGLLMATGESTHPADPAHLLAGADRILPELQAGSPAYAAATRFARLSPAARHRWLLDHLGALRGGRVTLAQLP